MTQITSEDALDLARLFKESALGLGQFQLDHWNNLSEGQRRDLTDQEYTLLDHSQNLVTYAVGVMLDEAQASLDDIREATVKANQAIQTVTNIKKVMEIATALITLGAAIYSANPSGIATAVSAVLTATTD
ncbi:MAG: hypothetical protein ABSC03_08920 [Verrucomicrobiota bacterium]|jgi:hypothetical protein